MAAQVAAASTKRERTTSSKTVARVVQDASSLRESTGGRVVACVLILFCDARLVFSTDGPRPLVKRPGLALMTNYPMHVRVAPPGPSFRAPSACREVIIELMSRERAQWHFVLRFSWRWRGRCTWECECQISGARFRKALPRRICCAHLQFQHRQFAQKSWSHSPAESC